MRACCQCPMRRAFSTRAVLEVAQGSELGRTNGISHQGHFLGRSSWIKQLFLAKKVHNDTKLLVRSPETTPIYLHLMTISRKCEFLLGMWFLPLSFSLTQSIISLASFSGRIISISTIQEIGANASKTETEKGANASRHSERDTALVDKQQRDK